MVQDGLSSSRTFTTFAKSFCPRRRQSQVQGLVCQHSFGGPPDSQLQLAWLIMDSEMSLKENACLEVGIGLGRWLEETDHLSLQPGPTLLCLTFGSWGLDYTRGNPGTAPRMGSESVCFYMGETCSVRSGPGAGQSSAQEPGHPRAQMLGLQEGTPNHCWLEVSELWLHQELPLHYWPAGLPLCLPLSSAIPLLGPHVLLCPKAFPRVSVLCRAWGWMEPGQKSQLGIVGGILGDKS